MISYKIPQSLSRLFEGDEYDYEQCAICLEFDFSLYTIIGCKCEQRYHKKCIKEWFEYSGVCPVCKDQVVPFEERPPASRVPTSDRPPTSGLTPLEKLFPESYEDISIENVATNGDCFFDCVSRAFPDLNVTNSISFMRALVAKAILEYNEKAQQAVQFWREIWKMAKSNKEIATMIEYSHVKCVEDVPIDIPLNLGQRKEICKNIMTNKFWAEEFSVRTVGEALDICFIIVDGDHQKFKPVFNEISSETQYILLYLQNDHYTLLLYKTKRRILKEENLPPEVLKLIKSSCV